MWGKAMTHNTFMIDQIEVHSTGLFTTHHSFEAGEEKLGELVCPAFGQQATFQASDGRTLSIRKTSWLGSSHELVQSSSVRGTAHPRKAFSRDLLVQYEGTEYLLRPEGILSRGWFLLDAGGTTLLEIQPRGVLRQGAFLYPRLVMDFDLVVFVYYLVFTRQQEEAAAAAAS
jgi:hypothetical protein